MQDKFYEEKLLIKLADYKAWSHCYNVIWHSENHLDTSERVLLTELCRKAIFSNCRDYILFSDYSTGDYTDALGITEMDLFFRIHKAIASGIISYEEDPKTLCYKIYINGSLGQILKHRFKDIKQYEDLVNYVTSNDCSGYIELTEEKFDGYNQDNIF